MNAERGNVLSVGLFCSGGKGTGGEVMTIIVALLLFLTAVAVEVDFDGLFVVNKRFIDVLVYLVRF